LKKNRKPTGNPIIKRKSEEQLRQVFVQLIQNTLLQSPAEGMNYEEIAHHLNLSDENSLEVIREILSSESKAENLQELENGKFLLKSLKAYIVGKVDMASSGSAYVISDETEEDTFIAPRKLRNALHGDTVKIFIYAKQNGSHKEGEVVEILERAKMEFTGIVKLSDRFGFLIPDNRKMHHDIFIPLTSLHGAQDGDKAQAKITEWPQGAKNPIGEIIQVLGRQGENNTEMNAILAEYGFPLSFPGIVEKEAERISHNPDLMDLSQRRDFRDTLTFTIDPVDAKDFDDALSYKDLGNGRVEVGIHIADVSHFVQPDSALDQEAYQRATSVYLVDRVIPMLPEKLSNELCSLRPHEDKLCFSAVFILNNKAEILDEWYGKTVIHSRRRFSYEEVQTILETGSGELIDELKYLNQLAHLLKDERFAAGAINFETTEVKFRLDPDGKPIGVYVKERKDAHKLIEEFMLLANRKVAEFVARKGDKKHPFTFVYRAHDQPDADNLLKFSQFAAGFGYRINTKSHKDISKSINKLMADVEGKKEQNVLTQLAIRSMAKAIYTTKSTSHYGLAFDYYTHFTSPIRRYPDVMAHRLLQSYLMGGKSVELGDYEKQCEHSSQMEKKAAEAERASVKYKQAEYLKDQVGQIFDGVVSGVTEWGMYVEIIENKCEGMIRLRDMDDDFYILDQANYCIIGQRKKKKFQLGDELKIKVKSVDLVKKQIDFSLVK
jgi:ribonuclease R